MKGLKSFKERLKKDLKNPEFKKAFDEEEVYASVAIQIAKLRQQKLHTTQQTISRLENINNNKYSLKTLIKIAQVFGGTLKIEFIENDVHCKA